MKYLIDTCIWRDFYEDRFSRTGRPLGEYAMKLFLRILQDRDIIIFSESLVWELRKKYDEEEISRLLGLFVVSKTLVRIEILKEEKSEAKKLAQERGIPFVDCLNAVQARNHNAILISQDVHFKLLSDITKAVLP
jgi:predicted nucleic acid-binding protein